MLVEVNITTIQQLKKISRDGKIERYPHWEIDHFFRLGGTRKEIIDFLIQTENGLYIPDLLAKSIKDAKYNDLTDAILEGFLNNSVQLHRTSLCRQDSLDKIFFYCYRNHNTDFLVKFLDLYDGSMEYWEKTGNSMILLDDIIHGISYRTFPPSEPSHSYDRNYYRRKEYHQELNAFAYRIMDKMENTEKMIKMLPKHFNIFHISGGYIYNKVLDATIGLKGSGLPTYVVKDIVSYAYDTSRLTSQELIDLISAVLEERPGRIDAQRKYYGTRRYKTCID